MICVSAPPFPLVPPITCIPVPLPTRPDKLAGEWTPAEHAMAAGRFPTNGQPPGWAPPELPTQAGGAPPPGGPRVAGGPFPT